MKILLEEDDKQELYIKEFVKTKLSINSNIDITTSESGIQGVVEFNDSDKLGVIMSKLDKDTDFDSNEDSTTLNDMGWVRIYNMNKEPYLSITLIGDYENDYNKVILFLSNNSEVM